MATLLVASTGAVSTSAVEVATEESGISSSELSKYVHEETGLILECETMDITNRNAFVSEETNLSIDFADLTTLPGMYEKKYSVELYTMSGDVVDYEQNPVTLYIPCERDDCYIMFVSYESGEPVQLDAEYVDGYYKVQMTDMGSFMICENPLLEGEGELVQQTLADEETGVSVSGMIESGSSLYVITIKDLYDQMVSMFNNEESYRYGSSFNLNEQPIAMATKWTDT